MTSADIPLDEQTRAVLYAVADVLVPGTGEMPSPSGLPDFDTCLDRAWAARTDAQDMLSRLAAQLDGPDLPARLAQLSREIPEDFETLALVVAGAYYLSPRTRVVIGYPGQERRPPSFDEAADQLEGLLDPVLARGSIVRQAPP
jgi:hypothetical protein